MAEPKVKDRVLQAVQDMPEDAGFEEVIERLYFLAKIEEGERQADAGELISTEEARRQVLG